jgi:ABC-type phosphate/phosphonate transport system substrate-binding protein
MVKVDNVIDALESVRDERADAAYVPTPILSRYPEATVIESSEQMPNMTMTASPRVSAEEVAKVRQALISASESEKGRRLLQQINISRFVAADPHDYSGLHELLAGMWGY